MEFGFKIKDEVDLESLLTGFHKEGDMYALTSELGEVIKVRSNRTGFEFGYDGLLQDWINRGVIEYIY